MAADLPALPQLFHNCEHANDVAYNEIEPASLNYCVLFCFTLNYFPNKFITFIVYNDLLFFYVIVLIPILFLFLYIVLLIFS